MQCAIRSLLEGSEEQSLAESTKYDALLDDGSRLVPKADLGIAVRWALGLDVGASHFRGGQGTPCFKIIRAAGLAIVPKGGDGDLPLDPEQLAWLEGGARRETHIGYERDPKAVRMKKQTCRDEHEGRLECEQCGCYAAEEHGRASGQECVEVHHTVPLGYVRVTRRTA